MDGGDRDNDRRDAEIGSGTHTDLDTNDDAACNRPGVQTKSSTMRMATQFESTDMV